MGEGWLIQPALLSNFHYSMKNWFSWIFLIHHKFSENKKIGFSWWFKRCWLQQFIPPSHPGSPLYYGLTFSMNPSLNSIEIKNNIALSCFLENKFEKWAATGKHEFIGWNHLPIFTKQCHIKKIWIITEILQRVVNKIVYKLKRIADNHKHNWPIFWDNKLQNSF